MIKTSPKFHPRTWIKKRVLVFVRMEEKSVFDVPLLLIRPRLPMSIKLHALFFSPSASYPQPVGWTTKADGEFQSSSATCLPSSSPLDGGVPWPFAPLISDYFISWGQCSVCILIFWVSDVITEWPFILCPLLHPTLSVMPNRAL